MKKLRVITLVSFLLITGIFSNSCYGPFNLTSKLYTWNGTVGGKWANSAVFLAFAILPVYEVSVALDALIFNAIEFWGGNNPISMEEGDEEIQIVKSGKKKYKITATKNKFEIEQIKGPEEGESVEILFAPEEYSCYFIHQGEKTRLVEYIPVESGIDMVSLYLPDGGVITMETSQNNYNEIQTVLRAAQFNLASRD